MIMPFKPLIVANWKLHKTIPEAVRFSMDLVKALDGLAEAEVVLGPPFTALRSVKEVLKGSAIALSAQNLYWEDEGAYTGEISAPLLVDAGCSYVIVGHSERRQHFDETDEQIHRKLKAAFFHDLIPILCVGETLVERDSGRTFQVVQTQLERALLRLSKEMARKAVIAYEPIWAIGTRKTATPAQAGEVHHFIRRFLKERLGVQTANGIRILYGGSVSPSNAKALLIEPVIDGILVGGASLELDSFIKIIQLACEGHQARLSAGGNKLSEKE
jgi:triosephosphate isomerase (TIM)